MKKISANAAALLLTILASAIIANEPATAKSGGPACITAPCGPRPVTYVKCRQREPIYPCAIDPVEYGKPGPCYVIDKHGVKKIVSHETAHRLLYGELPAGPRG